jgi:hypothetical protein
MEMKANPVAETFSYLASPDTRQSPETHDVLKVVVYISLVVNLLSSFTVCKDVIINVLLTILWIFTESRWLCLSLFPNYLLLWLCLLYVVIRLG